MEHFLESVSKHLHQKYGDGIAEICLVLPNKRGALFLKNHLAKVYNKTIFLPEILSAEDFIFELAELQPLDNIALTLQLYKSYCNCTTDSPEPFESFSRWATQALHDFNEIDRNLVEANQLFSNLKNIREIETWSLAHENLTPFQENYCKFMETLGILYSEFSADLLRDKVAYQGLAYRVAAKNSLNLKRDSSTKTIVFSGFSALNLAEEVIFNNFHAAGKAEFLWDLDNYYVKDKLQEAGNFFRKYETKSWYNKSSFTTDFLSETEKKIEIIGCSGNMGQVFAAQKQLTDLSSINPGLNRTAVVLCDETILSPLLNALPNEVDAVNVTLEYPVKYSNLFDLVDQLTELHISGKDSGGRGFYFRSFLKLIYNPVFQELLSDRTSVNKVASRLAEINISYLRNSDFQELFGDDYPTVNFLFEQIVDVNQYLLILDKLLDKLKTILISKKSGAAIELEFVFEFTKHIKRLKNIISEFSFLSDLKTVRNVLINLIGAESVPFFGEPLRGLQVMGVLETRTLDFDNLILLSVNEGVLPSGKASNSFIPNDLKRHFGLPLYSDKDSVYAYHFYRLLQRAKNITLIYNTETTLMGNGEKSRFVSQLQVELVKANPKISLSEKLFLPPANPTALAPDIIISNSDSQIEKLISQFSTNEKGGFSPSSFNMLRSCSLKFFYRYLAQIREPDKMEEQIESNTFGNILHEALEKIYRPFVDVTLTEKLLNSARPKVESEVTKAFALFFSSREIKYGKNLLAMKVVNLFVTKMINADMTLLKAGTKITIRHLEVPFTSVISDSESLPQAGLKFVGKCDRIDECDGMIRIIDYKSSVDSKDKFTFPGFEALFAQPGNEKMMQLIFYAWLYYKNSAIQPHLFQPMIIPFRSKGSGAYSLKKDKKEDFIFDVEFFNEFELNLKLFLAPFFKLESRFQPTPDLKTCEYCTYKSICQR